MGVDIIVGIPSYCEESSIRRVAEVVAVGLNKYFSNLNSLIVNVDNCSPDNTRKEFLKANTLGIPKKYLSSEPGVKGKGNNFFNLFSLVLELHPRAVIVVDADLTSIKPFWVRNLCEPVLAGADFVLPLYSRHKFDATITNHIVYPLIYGFYGINVRQPIGGEFGLSVKFIEYLMSLPWDRDVRGFGIDVFMTLNALLNNFELAQAHLGSKIHNVKDPATDLSQMFHEVNNTLLRVMRKHSPRLGPVITPTIIGEPQKKEEQTLIPNTKNLEEKNNYNPLRRRTWPLTLIAAAQNNDYTPEETTKHLLPLHYANLKRYVSQVSNKTDEEAEEHIKNTAKRIRKIITSSE